ncbi:MAG: hypothetical protein J5J00_10880 [Deltaproteobacteria bacterium]|nr:hypothetical protein [Deltaproteobacteria bacterium]
MRAWTLVRSFISLLKGVPTKKRWNESSRQEALRQLDLLCPNCKYCLWGQLTDPCRQAKYAVWYSFCCSITLMGDQRGVKLLEAISGMCPQMRCPECGTDVTFYGYLNPWKVAFKADNFGYRWEDLGLEWPKDLDGTTSELVPSAIIPLLRAAIGPSAVSDEGDLLASHWGKQIEEIRKRREWYRSHFSFD